MLVVAAPLGSAAAQQQDDLLSTPVRRFIFNGQASAESRAHFGASGYPLGTKDAVLALAWHTEVRIAFESLPTPEFDNVIPISVDVQNITVGEILKEIVHQDPRFKYWERFGVIEVLPDLADADPESCLNRVIPPIEFNYNLEAAFGNLRCITKGFDPFCGSRNLGTRNLPKERIDLSYEGQPLRDLLSKLSAMSGNHAWLGSYSEPERSCGSFYFQLYQPRRRFPADITLDMITKSDQTLVEGLPPQCTSCHYHEHQKQ